MKKSIVLKKIGNNKKELMWAADIDGNQVVYTWGQIGGKMQEEVRDFMEGKNIGRANETSPEEQCVFEAERKARKKMEGGYKLITGKLDTVSKTVVTSDTTVPAPMLAKTFEVSEKNVKKWRSILTQRKIDGNRCIVNLKTGQLYSRSRKEILSIPGLGADVQKACKNLKGVEWADGELYSSQLTFNQIQSIIRKTGKKSISSTKKGKDISISELAHEIKFNMFDYVSEEPFEVRAKRMREEVENSKRLTLVEVIMCRFEDIRKFHDKFVREGYEGIMLRNPDSPYETKRSSGLVKYKLFIDSEYEVIGWKAEKNDPSKMGSAILQTADGKTFNATPAMSDAEKAKIWKNKDKYIGMMATVKYQELDSESGIPRFPILKGFRDKSDLVLK